MTQDTGMQGQRRGQQGAALETTSTSPLQQLQVAEFEFAGGALKLKASMRLTPVGILAIGAMVSGIVLATSSLVWSATSAARRRADRRAKFD